MNDPVLIFDLDDTLYNEMSFVHSGFRAVAQFLSDKFTLNPDDSFARMCNELELNGRGNIFDIVLKEAGVYTKTNLNKTISTYRLHEPDISLSPEAERCLHRFEHYPKYLVTDGNKVVQYNKVRALNIEPWFKKVFVTHRYGLHASKPSPHCFHIIAGLEKRPAHSIVYIGDNPHKDFVGIKPLGFRTVRLINGMFANLALDEEHEAHVTVNSLDQVTDKLLAAL